MKTLKFEDGWMGGTWRSSITNINRIKINNTFVPVRIVVIKGKDYDMGHTYSWDNRDYLLELDTPIGPVEYSLRKYMKENDVTEFEVE